MYGLGTQSTADRRPRRPLGALRGRGTSRRDFGVDSGTVNYTAPGVRQMAQTGRLLLGRYIYPSLVFYVSLGAALPDAAGAIPDNMHRGVHR